MPFFPKRVTRALGGGPEVRHEHVHCNRSHGAKLKEARRKAGFSRSIAKRAISRPRKKYPPRKNPAPRIGGKTCRSKIA